jgi:hypothetical protein
MALPASAQKYAGSGSFTPTSIAGCQLWLDAADTSSMSFSSGSNINQWRDKSGLTNHATGVNSPVLSGNAISTYQAVTSTTNQYFTGSTSVTGTTVTVFSIAKTTRTLPNASSDQRLVSLANGANVDYGRADGVIALFNQGGTSSIATWRLSSVAASGITQNVAFQAVCKYDGTTGYIWKDGTSGGSSASSGTFAVTKYGIGNQANPTAEYWIGSIGEVLIYNVALGDTPRQQIEGYLAWKWGLQSSLPAGHPYKSASPSGSSTRASAIKGRAPTVFPATTTLSARATKTGFNAQQIAGLQLWMDASDLTTFTFTSGKISQWTDKSSNAYPATQANATYQPTIQLAGLNKKNTVNFSLDYMETPEGSAVYPHDCYCVIALKDTTTNVDFIGSSAHYLDNFNSLTFSDYTTSRWENGSTTYLRTPNTVSATNETSTGYLIMRWSIGNGNYQLWRNGVQLSQASYNYTQTALSFYILGQRSTQYLTNLLQGYIAEIQIYTTQLPTAQQQIVEGNLAWKWGLQSSLPLTHAYARYPPLPFIGPPVPAVVVTTTLVENLDASTYTSGSTWTAATGNNYAITGTFTTTSTPGGSTAIVLDGSSYAQDSTGITASSMYLYTLDLWFYSAAGQSASIVGEGGQANLGGWNVTVISVDSNTVSVGFWIGSVYRLSVGSYTANTWTHVAYSYNNTTGAVVGYLNGQRVVTGTATKQWPSNIFYTTGGGMNPFGNFTGRIGAFKAYSSVLTDAQVSQNFNALRGRFGI